MTEMKRLLFVYNPHAGKGLLKPKVSDIIDIFVKAGYEVTAYPTQAYHDAYRKIREFTDHYDLVVCSGGDGTIDEVVTGMMAREERVPVGYIPTGTTNDFAHSLKIPRDILAAADNAVNGQAFPCDVGQFNDGISSTSQLSAFLQMYPTRPTRQQRISWDIWPMCWKVQSVFSIYRLTGSR